MQMPDDELLQQLLQQYPGMTPEQKEKLFRDYPGLQKMLAGDRRFGEDMALTPMPKGQVAGPGSNPFSVYVAANPLEHIAAGAKQFMGHRERRAASEEMRRNSADQADMLRQAAEAGILRGGGQPQGSGWLEEDEWERLYGSGRRA